MTKGITLKKVVARASLILLGLGLGILILEIGLKASCSEAIFQEPHEIYGFFNIPNKEGWSCGDEFKVWVKINSKGLRDREYPYEKPENVYRILALGDSFTAAVQVPLETTFHKQLETLLNQQHQGVRYEVIGAGVEDWGTGQELLFFREEGYKYNPDLVLLMFYVGNDVLENSVTLSGSRTERRPYFTWNQAENSLGPVTYVSEPEEEETINPVKGILRNSSIYWLARDRLMRSPTISRFLVEKGIMTNFSDSYNIYLQDYPPELEESWLVTQALLKQWRDDVEKQNASLVVVLIPTLVQVNEEMWGLAQDIYLHGLEKSSPDKPDTLLLHFLEKEKILYLHLLPYFQVQPDPVRERLYLPHDGHWDVEGHHLVSQLIHDYLVTTVWSPQPND